MLDKKIDINALYGVIQECLDLFETKYKLELTTTPQSKSYQVDLVFMAILAKSMKTARAIVILTRNGYGEDAVCLVRSMFENSVHLAYVFKEDSVHRADLFLKYGQLDFFKKVEALSGNPISHKTEIDELELLFAEEFRKIKNEHGEKGVKKHSWSCLSLRKMSESVGATAEYEKLYHFMSQYSHPHSQGLSDYCAAGSFNDSPGSNMVEEALVFEISYLIQLLEITNKSYSFGFETTLEGLNMQYGILLGMEDNTDIG